MHSWSSILRNRSTSSDVPRVFTSVVQELPNDLSLNPSSPLRGDEGDITEIHAVRLLARFGRGEEGFSRANLRLSNRDPVSREEYIVCITICKYMYILLGQIVHALSRIWRASANERDLSRTSHDNIKKTLKWIVID